MAMFRKLSVYFSVLHIVLFFCPQLSQQILDLFHACEQQNDDLEKKEHCRAALQRDIQTIFPCTLHIYKYDDWDLLKIFFFIRTGLEKLSIKSCSPMDPLQ